MGKKYHKSYDSSSIYRFIFLVKLIFFLYFIIEKEMKDFKDLKKKRKYYKFNVKLSKRNATKVSLEIVHLS